MKEISINVFIIILVFGLVGCMGPQGIRDRRIEQESAVFSTFSPEIQEEIRLGHVKVGFTEDMVRLALGKSDRVYTRTTDEGVNTVWTYVDTEMGTGREYVRIPVFVLGAYGLAWLDYDTVYVRTRIVREYTAIRVEFKDGKVVAVERLQR